MPQMRGERFSGAFVIDGSNGHPSRRGVARLGSVRTGFGGFGDLDGVNSQRSIATGAAASRFCVIPVITAPSDIFDFDHRAEIEADIRVRIRSSKIGDPAMTVAVESIDNIRDEMDA